MFFNFCIKHRYSLILFWTIAFVLSLVIIVKNFNFNTSLYSYLGYSEESAKRFIDFRKKFNGDSSEIILIKIDQQQDKNAQIEKILTLAKHIKTVTGIYNVISVHGYVSVNQSESAFELQRPIKIGEGNHEAYLDEVLTDPLFRNNLISLDKKHFAIFYQFDKSKNKRALRQVNQFVLNAGIAPQNISYTGYKTIEREIRKLTLRDLLFFAPLCGFVVFLGLLFLFRSIFQAVILGLFILVPCYVSLGIMVLLGFNFNLSTMLLPTLLMAIALSDICHVTLEYMRECQSRNIKSVLDAQQRRDVFEKALNKVLKACFMTSFTTAIGLLALYASDMPPIKEFALAGAIGVMLVFFSTLSLMTAWFYISSSEKLHLIHLHNPFLIKIDGMLSVVNDLLYDKYKIILAAISAIVVASFLSVLNPIVESNFLEYLPGDNKVRQGVENFNQHMAGVGQIAIIIKNKEGGHNRVLSVNNIEPILNLKQQLAKLQGIGSVVSIFDFVKTLEPTLNINDDELARTMFMLNEFGEFEIVHRYYAMEDDEILISLRVKHQKALELQSLVKEVRQILKQSPLQENFALEVTGDVTLISDLIPKLLWGQLLGFLFVLFVISSIFYYLTRSIKKTVIAVINNIIPCFIIGAAMFFFEIPLNVINLMVLSIVLGLSVDDTIHFMVRHKSGEHKASLNTLNSIGAPIVVTSIFLLLGMSVFLFGVFPLTVEFGLLVMLGIFVALLCDYLFLPAALRWMDESHA